MELAPSLPDVHNVVLDTATLAELFGDLEACADIQEIRLKSAATARADAGTITELYELLPLIEKRAVRGVQIRYRFEGKDWLDTLLVGANAIELVRIEVPQPPGG